MNSRVSWFVGIVAFGLYFLTLCPTVWWVDSGELTTAAATLGFGHPPGTGLHSLIGCLFTLLPIGDVGYRVNLLSATGGAVASALAAATVRRAALVEGVEPLAAALGGVAAGLTLATSLTMWTVSTVTEVYSLFITVLLLAFYSAVRFVSGGRRGWMLLGGLGLGLAVTLRPTVVPYALLLLAWMLLRLRIGTEDVGYRTRGRDLVAGLIGVAIGLFPWVYLPLRLGKSPVEFCEVATFKSFVLTVTGLSFRSHLSHPDLTSTWQQLRGFAAAMPSEVGAAGVTALVLALWRVIRSGVRGIATAWAVVALSDIALLVWFAPYGNGLQHYGMAAYAVLCLLAGLGFAHAFAWRNSPAVRVAVAAAAGLSVITNLALNLGTANRARDWSAHDYARAALAEAAPNALIFCQTDYDFFPLLPFVYAEEGALRRKDVTPVHLGTYEEQTGKPWQTLLQANIGKRPVYLAFANAELPKGLQAIPEGVLFRVQPAGLPFPIAVEPATKPVAQFGDAILLDSVRVDPDTNGARLVWVTYRWRTLRQIGMDLWAVAVFTDAEGHTVVRGGEVEFQNIHPLGGGSYPVTVWKPGDAIEERYAVPVPGEATAGTYTLHIGLIRPSAIPVLRNETPPTPKTIYDRRNEAFGRYLRTAGPFGRFQSFRIDAPGPAPDFLPLAVGSGGGGEIVEKVFVRVAGGAVQVLPDRYGIFGVPIERGGVRAPRNGS